MKDYKIQITMEIAEAAVLGGVFLGGGGGGAVASGLNIARKALEHGDIYLISLSSIDKDCNIITASAVGSPASKEGYVTAKDCKRAFELYEKVSGEKIQGVITNENGGHSTTNGWVLSAMTGIPLIDAPCNGRAHPTGTMGSMGLSKDNEYRSWQVAIGGNPDIGKYMETVVWGRLESTSRLVRRTAVEAGGLVTVLRNVVKADYLEKHAAPGGLLQAIRTGEVFIENRGNPPKILEDLGSIFDIEVLAEGSINNYSLEIKDGFDVGALHIEGEKNSVEVSFWNEYMTAEKGEYRLATFPDLIVTMNSKTGEVITSAEIKNGDEVILLKVPRKELILGQGMYDQILLKQVEDIIGKPLIPYVW